MKALTNILTRMLMLLLMVALATCTTDDGADEVMPMDDGMVQLKVDMTVPNLKITTRAADEGETLNAIKGLCYDGNGTLTKIADATDITTTTFNMRVPAETRTIHFLANLPNDCTLPEVWTTTETDLLNLTTKSSSMTYWGRTTFNTTPTDCNITFYRNKARIFIKAADGSSVGTVGIAGVVNAYDTGMLVPYNDGAYNFDLSNNDYPTVPTEDFTKDSVMVDTNPLPTQYDVFEHPNTGTSQASSLYAICLIGSKYYKVALGTPDEDGMVTEHYFPIIRNHKYVISVADVDDVDASLGANLPNDAVNLAPINDPNIKVKDVVDVVVTLSTSTETLDYNTTSISNLILSVTVPPEVDKLTLSTPGFTVATFSDTNMPDTETKYLVDNGNGSFTVNHPANDEEHTFSFRLKLNDNPQQSYDLFCTAASNDANVQITQPKPVAVSLNKVADNANLYWMGASPLDYYNSPSKIPISAAKLTKGATVTLEYEKAVDGTPQIGLQHAKWGNFTSLTTLDLSNSTMTSFTIDETLYNEIQANKNQVYELPDAGMVVQGKNVTLKKITIQPAVTFEYQDNQILQVGGNPLTVTMRVPDGGTLNTLTILAPGFTIKQDESELGTDSYNGTDLNYTNRDITYTFVPNSAGIKTITFSNAQGTNLNISSLPVIEVTVNATIIATPTQQTIYYDGNNKSFNVSVNIPKGVNALSIDGAGSFIVTRQSQNGTLDGYNYTPSDTNGQTAVFSFTYNGAQSESTQTITFKDASNNPNVTVASVTVSVKKTETEEPVLVVGENNIPLNNLPFTLENNNGIVLLKASGNNVNGLLESYRTYLKENVTLKIKFTSEGETNPLSFQTTWSDPVEGVFSQIESNKYLSYTFKSSDFDKGNGGAHTIANAGLELKTAPNSTATITAISIIIPASTP